MRKPTICICENKDEDQHLRFRYTDGTIPLHSDSKISSPYPLCACTTQFVLDLFGNHLVGFLMWRLISYLYTHVVTEETKLKISTALQLGPIITHNCIIQTS